MNGVNSIEALEHASSPARSLWLSSVNPPRGRGDSFFRVSGRRRERESPPPLFASLVEREDARCPEIRM